MPRNLVVVHDEGLTNASWAVLVETLPNGRGATLSQYANATDISTRHTSDIAISLLDSAGGSGVNTGAAWSDMDRTPTNLSGEVVTAWPDYGGEVRLRVYARSAGVWRRTPGISSGQPQGVEVLPHPGIVIANFIIDTSGNLLPSFTQNVDWEVSVRSLVPNESTAGRYVTLDQVIAIMGTPAPGDDSGYALDGSLTIAQTLALESAESWVDDICSQSFDPAPSQAETRTYYPTNPGLLMTDPFVSVSSVRVGESTSDLPMTSWKFYEAPTTRRPGYGLERQSGLWVLNTPVHITGRFGWPQVPPQVKQAIMLMAPRFYEWSFMPLGMKMLNDNSGGVYASKKANDVRELLMAFITPGAH